MHTSVPTNRIAPRSFASSLLAGIAVTALAFGAAGCASGEPTCQTQVSAHEGGAAFADPIAGFPMFVTLHNGQQRELEAQVVEARGEAALEASWTYLEDGLPNQTIRHVSLPAIPDTVAVVASAPFHDAEEGPYSYGVLAVATGMVEDGAGGELEKSWLVLIHSYEAPQMIELALGSNNAYAVAASSNRADVQLAQVDQNGGILTLMTASFLADATGETADEEELLEPMVVATSIVDDIDFLATDVQNLSYGADTGWASLNLVLKDRSNGNWHNVALSDECLQPMAAE